MSAEDQLVGRATRLFDFLAQAARLKSPPAYSLDSYDSVVWLHALPGHPAIRVIGDAPEIGDGVLAVDRVPRVAPPEPDALLAARIAGPVDDPEDPPALTEDPDAPPLPDGAFAQYLRRWHAWAAQDLVDRPARQLYVNLFTLYNTASGNPEELELLVGVGCLAWAPDRHAPIRRHLFTAPVTITFDDRTGQLRVAPAESLDTLTLELDMIDPGLATSDRIDDIRTAAAQLDAHPMDKEQVGTLARRLVHTLDPDGGYSPAATPPAATARAIAGFAPALILRRRSQLGLVQLFTTVGRQVGESGYVPPGIVPLLDPDYRPPVDEDPTEGAVVAVDDDAFLPLPVNDVQRRILAHVDAHAQTLVQGPPGTGKTHTAAALLSHLLAQGKRVLVTAHTDRALKEVRAKLPPAIRPLSVAVVGGSREEMTDLKVSVEHIVSVAADHDPDAAARTVAACLDTIEQLRVHRAERRRELREGREAELAVHEHGGYRGTYAAIARRRHDEAATYRWIGMVPDEPAPLSDADAVEWLALLTDPALATDLADAAHRLVDLDAVPDPAVYGKLLAATATRSAPAADLTGHPAYPVLRDRPAAERDELRTRLRELANAADDLSRRREAWMGRALDDVRSGRGALWDNRARAIAELIGRADPAVSWLDPLTEVRVTGDVDLGVLVALAAQVRAQVADGAKLKVEADGRPKLGALAPKPLKAAQPFFDAVRVNGLAATTTAQLDAFRAWADATTALAALDRAWPDGTHAPAEDTLHERLQWHKVEHEQLTHVLDLGRRLDAEVERLSALGLPRPDWTDLTSVRGYADVVDAASAADAEATAYEPLERLDATLAEAAQWDDADRCVTDLLAAARDRDPNAYARAHARLDRLWMVRELAARRDALGARLPARLRTAVEASADDPAWAGRLADFGRAWDWAATGEWLRARPTTSDVNALQDEITRTEERIRGQVEILAATRAWSHAVSDDRLTGRARANLTQYAQLVRALGKGTGKYAEKRRHDIRQALDRCRPSVPVWIMPVYRIAEQFPIRPDMFDVVIVDEASQAGLEATFLSYLAPKMVVIGDDKQVSPAAVGIDQQALRDLARRYLPDDPYRASWEDPQRSLFDEAKMRFSGMLTLTEHRRCVPEIIGFSNRVAYEPDGIRLVPVRQYGADRLEPIRTVYVPGATTRGTTGKVNQAEVDAIVEQVEKCAADPRYDGLTFGVISLLGPAQATAIERALLERLPAAEWLARDLRCGDSTDFQGSERDVMFLSMVVAPEPGTRPAPLTRALYVQRFNVAASRAKDQMWVFHSVEARELGNAEDMRFALLDYCYGVQLRAGEPRASTVVSDDELVEPFGSLFAQRVHNRVVEAGYTVIPSYDAEGYRIDLVVEGAKGRLAVACDGDTWAGPEAYERDLARQRDLERCGWEFFRVRETDFYTDRARVLGQLWETLGELDIRPVGEVVPESRPVEPEPVAVVPAARPVDTYGLEPHVSFEGALPPTQGLDAEQLVAGLAAILRAEGPMLGQRLFGTYVRASGARRTGPLIGEALESALRGAVASGAVLAEDPLAEVGPRGHTYRLPEQPPVRPRTLGARKFEEIPPTELAALLDDAAAAHGWDSDETLFRAVLDRLGLKRLTAGVCDRLRAVRPLTAGGAPAELPVTAMFADPTVDASSVVDWVAATGEFPVIEPDAEEPDADAPPVRLDVLPEAADLAPLIEEPIEEPIVAEPAVVAVEEAGIVAAPAMGAVPAVVVPAPVGSTPVAGDEPEDDIPPPVVVPLLVPPPAHLAPPDRSSGTIYGSSRPAPPE